MIAEPRPSAAVCHEVPQKGPALAAEGLDLPEARRQAARSLACRGEVTQKDHRSRESIIGNGDSDERDDGRSPFEARVRRV
jgi:hypothetical protein